MNGNFLLLTYKYGVPFSVQAQYKTLYRRVYFLKPKKKIARVCPERIHPLISSGSQSYCHCKEVRVL